MATIAEVIKDALEHGESYELINKRLDAMGCGFHLVKKAVSGWTDEELRGGFKAPGEAVIEPEDAAEGAYEGNPEYYNDLSKEMERHVDRAGTVKTMWTKQGRYSITYNELGYCVKAVKHDV